MYIRNHHGVHVHYHTFGSGPTVVLLHPVAMNTTFWSGLIESLADRYRFVAIDLRGHGQSEVPRSPFTLEDLADDVADVIAHCSREPVAILGLSLGGMIAQLVALRHPQQVGALVLANTRAQVGPPQAEALEARARRAEEGGMAGVLDETIQRWFTPDFLRYQPAVIDTFTRTLLAADPTVHAMTWRAMKALNNADALDSIQVPTMVLHGAEDAASPVEGARAMARAIPNATYAELPGVGHMSVVEQPVAFAAAVDRFLSGVSPTAT